MKSDLGGNEEFSEFQEGGIDQILVASAGLQCRPCELLNFK